MTVSVVIPTYRSATFIGRTLTSVFAQTRPPVEVVVVDDGSPDDTVAAVERIAAAAPVPVRVIALRENSGGPARPLNVGIAAARGESIAPLDHDDEFFPRKLEDQTDFLARCPGVGLVFGDIDSVRADGAVCVEHQQEAEGHLRAILRGATPVGTDGFRIPSAAAYNGLVAFPEIARTCGNLLFPKAVWQAVGGFDERFRSTCDLQMFHAISRRFDVGYLRRKTARWHQVPTNLTRQSTANGAQSEELCRLWLGMGQGRLSAASRARLRDRVSAHANSVAFGLRNEGRYLLAARWYAIGVLGGRPSAAGVLGLAKLAPHCVARWLGGGQRAALES